MSKVTFVKTEDREKGVESAIKSLGTNPVNNKHVLIKPNFNTADTVPGSTDNETLLALVDKIWKMGARSISLGERSYPPTRQVMEQKGIIPLLEGKDVRISVRSNGRLNSVSVHPLLRISMWFRLTRRVRNTGIG